MAADKRWTGDVGKWVTLESSGGSQNSSAKKSTADDSLALYMQYYSAAAARERELAAAKQALAQQAYDKNVGALNDAYWQRGNLLNENLETTMNDLQRGYDGAEGKVNQNTNRALQEAYVNMMMNKRDLPQLLAAQGITGGMSEGTLAGIRGGYGSARNSLETSRNDALGELLNTLLSSQSEAKQTYNNQVADDNLNKTNAKIGLEQALADGIAKILTDQYSNLGKLESAYVQQMAKVGGNANVNFGALADTTSLLSALNSAVKTDYSVAKSALQSGNITAQQLKTLLYNDEVSEGSAIVTLMNAGLSEEDARALVGKAKLQ